MPDGSQHQRATENDVGGGASSSQGQHRFTGDLNHSSVTPRRAMKGITNMPDATSDSEQDPRVENGEFVKGHRAGQPATRAVCMRCTARRRPGSLMTTVYPTGAIPWVRFGGTQLLMQPDLRS